MSNSSDKITISIKDVVEGPIWVSANDGQKVFSAISDALQDGYKVELSFVGREHVITAFLNVAVGQLYSGKYAWSDLETRLSFSGLADGDADKLDMVIVNAKRYFQQRNQTPSL